MLVDNQIIQKLLNYSKKRIQYFGIDNAIVIDWENISFLNPLGLGASTINQFESMLSELNMEGDEPMTKLLGSPSKSVGEMTIGLLKTTSEQESKNLDTIKQEIISNIIQHGNNEHVVSKYIWFLEFIKWFEKDETSKLKFEYLTERLKEDKQP